MVYPSVSIIIPCRNEEEFLGKCLDSIVANDYPKDKYEVLIIDGMSGDGTRKIIRDYIQKNSFIKLLDNPKRMVPCALNVGIKSASGEIIIRMDAHATYENDYISKCVRYLNEYNADNVGGAMVTLSRDNTFIGKAIITTLTHPFGIGNNSCRTGSNKPKCVDTLFCGCYKREVFDKIGLFNEDLVRSQDIEFNKRLTKAGGKILLVPEIVSYYYAQSKFKSFVKSNFCNGAWIIIPFMYSNIIPLSWRHLIPIVFVISLISTAVFSFFFQAFLWLFLFISGSYLLANLYFSVKIAVEKKVLRYIFIMPVIFASLHITYGVGSLWGLLRITVSKQFWSKFVFRMLKNNSKMFSNS